MHNLMSIGARIKERRKALKHTQRHLAEAVGVDVTTVTRWENDTYRPDEEKIETISRLLDTTPAWIAFGQGKEGVSEIANTQISELPIIGRVEAGAWREAVREDQPITQIPFNPHPSFNVTAQVGFQVRGESCNMVARDGDILVAAPYEMIPGGIEALIERDPPPLVIAQRVRAGLVEATVKELRYTDGRFQLWPKSTHPDHQETVEFNENGDTEEIRVSHVVLQVVARYF